MGDPASGEGRGIIPSFLRSWGRRVPPSPALLAALAALAILAAAATLLLLPPMPALRIEDGAGRTLVVFPLPDGTFVHHYTHSIHLSAVDEHFRIEGGRLRLYELRYDTNSVGMPSDAELGFRLEGNRFVLAMDRRFDRIPIRVSDLPGHGVVIGGVLHPFSELMRPEGQVALSRTVVLAQRFRR